MEKGKNILNPKLSLGQRITILFSLFVLGLLITLFANFAFTGIESINSKQMLIFATIIQNVFAFVVPAAVAMLFITTKPLDFLQINKLPPIKVFAAMLVTIIVIMPAFNWITEWNKNITFPESLASVEQFLRASENAAEQVTTALMTGNSIFGMIVIVLVIGVLTGFSEEFFFRGTLQRIFFTHPINIHIAIWLTAIIFSAMHMQFFGFFPRIILGAFFGYLMWWSGSLWLPILAHIINNSAVVIMTHFKPTGSPDCFIEQVGITEGFPLLAIASLIATIALMIAFSNYFKKEKEKD